MARTKDELAALLVRRLTPPIYEALTGAQVLAALTGAPPVDRDALLIAIRNRSPGETGRALLRIVNDYVRTQAKTEADTILVDDSVSLVELDRLLP